MFRQPENHPFHDPHRRPHHFLRHLHRLRRSLRRFRPSRAAGQSAGFNPAAVRTAAIGGSGYALLFCALPYGAALAAQLLYYLAAPLFKR